MRKLFLAFALLASTLIAQAQKSIDPTLLKVAWSFSESLFVDKIKDPLTHDIVSVSVPLLIDGEYHAAAMEICNTIYTVKNIKVLNKQYLSLLETDLQLAVNSVKSKDFFSTVSTLLDVAAYTYDYINSGVLDIAESSEKIDPVTEAVEIDSTISYHLYISRFNDYVFYMPETDIFLIPYDLFNETPTVESEEEHIDYFQIFLPDESFYKLKIEKAHSSDNFSTYDILENPEYKKFYSELCAAIFERDLGPGKVIEEGEADISTIKAMSFVYSYKQDDGEGNTSDWIADVYVVFIPGTFYSFTFDSLASDYSKNKPIFDKAIETFYVQ